MMFEQDVFSPLFFFLRRIDEDSRSSNKRLTKSVRCNGLSSIKSLNNDHARDQRDNQTEKTRRLFFLLLRSKKK